MLVYKIIKQYLIRYMRQCEFGDDIDKWTPIHLRKIIPNGNGSISISINY